MCILQFADPLLALAALSSSTERSARHSLHQAEHTHTQILGAMAGGKSSHPECHFAASGVAAIINFPLWRAAAIGQSGFDRTTNMGSNFFRRCGGTWSRNDRPALLLLARSSSTPALCKASMCTVLAFIGAIACALWCTLWNVELTSSHTQQQRSSWLIGWFKLGCGGYLRQQAQQPCS